MINKFNKPMDLYLNRRMKVSIFQDEADSETLVSEEELALRKSYIATMLKNIEVLGFTLSEKVIETLKLKDTDFIVEFYSELVTVLKNMVGQGENMIPMYPNFPEQVMEMSEVEFYINAIIHYISLGTILPEYEAKEKFPLIGNYNLKVIDLGSVEDYESILTNLLASKIALSENDQKDVSYLIESIDNLDELIPDNIPIKENLTFATPLLMAQLTDVKPLLSLYKTATDVLRLATVMSGGHPSLKYGVKFKSFKRKDRKFLLTLLENCNNIEEDMLRYKTLWIKLGEKLHPFEYKSLTKVNVAFDKLRNKGKIVTFKGRLEEAFERKNVKLVVSLLSKRPGEFARSLDRVLRMVENEDANVQLKQRLEVVDSFRLIANKLPSKMLLDLKSYFSNRDKNDLDIRAFFPKGSVSNAYVIENELKPLETKVCRAIERLCVGELTRAYSEREELGKVFIDAELKSIVAPTVLRTASKTLRNLSRGSRLKLKDTTKFIRPFIYWKQPEGERVDLDLSVLFLDENFNRIGYVSYSHYKEEELGAVHSGDITSAPKGACEFVDINIEKAKKAGVKYVISSVYSFTQTPFKDLPECFAGYMERDNKTGEIFEPKTVENKSDLASTNIVSLTNVIDLDSREAIWMDLGLNSTPSFRANNVENNQDTLVCSLKAILNAKKSTLYDVVKLNAFARGEIVDDVREADVVFSLKSLEELYALYPVEETDEVKDVSDEDKEETETKVQRLITPYEVDIIISDFI